MSSPPVIGQSQKSRRRPLAALAALALAASGLAAPHAAADPAPKLKPRYDHSREKGRPGTKGPLPKGFSRTSLQVKFRTELNVRLHGNTLTSSDSAATAAIRAAFARYPGAIITRTSRQSVRAIDDRRSRLEAKTGRELPDFNSWFFVTVPKNGEGLLAALNALSGVEIAQARPVIKSPTEPLRAQQLYRNAVGSPAGTGIDADAINNVPGGKGDGVTVGDVEAVANANTALFGIQWGQIAAGLAHTLAVDVGPSAPTVWATGSNSHGELGDGTTTSRTTPVLVSGLSGVKTVAAANSYSLALKTDGTVWAWGSNSVGQLGDGTTTERHTPVQVSGITNATAISAGSDGHALAVLSDGTVKAWGSNTNGQLGDGTTTNRSTPTTVPGLTGVKTTWGAVAAGGGQSLAVLTSGTVKAWGTNSSGQLGDGTTTNRSTPVSVPGITTGKQVAAGGFHSLAVLTDGSVKAWGLNGSGQLGDGTTTSRTSPVNVPLPEPAASVVAGGFHSAAESYDPDTHDYYSAWAWGYNNHGQVGDGTTTTRTSPTAVTTEGFVTALAAGAQYTVASFAFGQAAWGYNSSGQLGLGDTTDRTSPVSWNVVTNSWNTCHEELSGRPAPGGDPVRVPATWGSNCLASSQTSHGTAVAGIIGARDGNGAGIAGIAPNAGLHLSNPSDYVTTLAGLGSGDVVLYEFSPVIGSKWYPGEYDPLIYDATVTATAQGITVVEAAGNGSNNLDDPSDPDAVTVMSRPDSGAIMVGAGAPPSPGGSNCTGSSPLPERTALGFSTYGSRLDVQDYGACVATLGVPGNQGLTPSETDPNKMYTGTFNGTSSASAITAGAVAALQGVAKKTGSALLPAQIRQLLKQTGTAQPAGDPHHIGPQPNLRAAVNYLRGGVAAGTNHTLDVRNDGTVRAWGANSSGQLGNGTTTGSATSVQVSGLTNVVRAPGSVAAGQNHSLAVRADGTVWAWGANGSGQLGNGSTTASSTPVQVSGLTGVKAVAAGLSFSLALKNDGTVWAWGDNSSGQLGNGTTTSASSPVQVSGITDAAVIGAGYSHGLAVRADGSVKAWGANSNGQLGNGTTTNSGTPVTVSGLSGVSTWPGSLAGGFAHSLAVLADGTVRAWGLNNNGQLGNGTTTASSTPVTVTGLSGAATVGAGGWHSVAAGTAGTAKAWGLNANGQLGDGTTTSSTTPVSVGGSGNFAGIAAGTYHSIAVLSGGAPYTWGKNASGQVGDGTTTDRPSPVAVSGLS
ncbi:Regulator of chromosome condensation (RCC1) repeat protein [Actinomadura rubteroloni]|uniref:Regulator of chromosome condensation (RCC1) repeat protein n=1 Tax=Actinomadura rubteroloni TaxID=1926885 RepID=A0A2P4ULC1_9ACTN|nr:S8 family serine peptidase [Actinomadura rubteroloni]POM25845.1 Regulator of chromosome condensation (RCC1) repeat protein [Actinomadura rubteroloni]